MKPHLSRRHFLASLSLAATSLSALAQPAAGRVEDGKLRIICFGAHPDDCELQTGGVGALWAQAGHHVKFVSVTNGDIGHWRQAGGPLALRRKEEVEQASKILGTHVEVLDIHDGELMPTLENRRHITRLIRQWRADIVFSPRPNDYHPDHRYTGVLVQDAAYMVAVPFICPDTPPLARNPLFLFYTDRFQKPNPSTADIVVSIDAVIEKKLDALAVMESQFLEGGATGSALLLPKTPADKPKRIAAVRASHAARFESIADRFRKELKQWHGDAKGAQVKHAEAFEICEYGRRPDAAELKKLFPFFS